MKLPGALNRRRRLAALACLLALLGFGAAARADYVQQGKLLVFFDAGIKPKTLPRSEPAPVKVGFVGNFENVDGSDVPALETMTLRLARGGVLSTKGLPRCSIRRLAQRTTQGALAACRRSLVGSGSVGTAIRFPDGRRQRYRSELLLFNARRTILMHIYTTDPLEGTFVIPLRVSSAAGRFATTLRARFPRLAAGYGYLTGFRMTLFRTYLHNGARRSYLLASCAAPRELNRVAFELARVEFRFEGGTVVRNSSLNVCRVRR